MPTDADGRTHKGFLTGKVKRGDKPSEGRMGWVAENESKAMQSAPSWKTFDDQAFDALDALQEIAKKRSKTIPQVAIRWLLQRDVVTSVIIGATKLAQLDDNMGANGWSLTQEEMRHLTQLTELRVPYPYEYINKLNLDRANNQNGDLFVRDKA